MSELRKCYKCNRLFINMAKYFIFPELRMKEANNPNKFCSKECEQSSEFR